MSQKKEGMTGRQEIEHRKQITLRRKEADAGQQRKELKNYFKK